MSDYDVIATSTAPLTTPILIDEFRRIGVDAGMSILLHSSLSRLGYVVGGAASVIDALLHILTPSGTLMVPTHSDDNTEPSYWQAPPVPPDWWPIIRATMPAYHPAYSPTRGMGRIPDTLRQYPGAKRSAHPALSFAAVGAYADFLTDGHSLEHGLGEHSPLARLYDLDGWILLLGVDHSNNTSLHLAEERAEWPGKAFERQGSAMLVNGERQWVEYESLCYEYADFAKIGDSYELAHEILRHTIGKATVRFLKQRPLVDDAVRRIPVLRSANPKVTGN